MVISPQPGTMVTSNVRLVRPLGAGGMGSVWVAEHLALHTQVVVKFMSPELAANDEAAGRFSREAAAAAQVKSPHVVQVFDYGVTQGLPYIVMELLEGHDLATYIEQGPLPPADVAEIIAQVGKALGRAHAAGIVHRDIKPENIFLCDVEGGEVFVKLLDFGIAKAESQKLGTGTKTGQVVGTPYYMSPEQIVGAKTVDLRADLWSLGVVAFEALTGNRPFEAENVGALTLAIHGPTPSPSALAPGLPAELDAWFARACAKEPEQRFASARDLAHSFAEAIGRAPAATMSRRLSFRPAASSGSTTGPRQHDVQAATALGASITANQPQRGGGFRYAIIAAIGLLVFGIGAAVTIKLVGPKAAASSPPEPTTLATSTSTATASSTSAPPATPSETASSPTSPPNLVASTTGRPLVHSPRPSATVAKSAPPPPALSAPKPKPTSNEDDIK